MASSSRRTSSHSHGGDDYDSDDDKDYDYSGGGKKIWSVQATEYYIRLLEKYKEKLWSPEAQAAHYTVKNSIWADLTQEMIKAGYQLNQPQCRKKLENLKRGFNTCTPRKLVKFVNFSNGNRKKVESTSRSWPFYSQFLPIMNYIIANKVGSDKSVALQRAAPILEAARIEGHLDNLDTNTNGSSSSLPSHNTSIDEDEVSITEDLFASEYNHYTNTNGIENGHSEITSIVASAFDNSDLGYGSGIMSIQSIGGSQDYYQMQTFNSQPNTDGDIMIQVLDPLRTLSTLRAPVKVEQVHDYNYSQYETGTDMEQDPPQLIQIGRITAPAPTTTTPAARIPPRTPSTAVNKTHTLPNPILTPVNHTTAVSSTNHPTNRNPTPIPANRSGTVSAAVTSAIPISTPEVGRVGTSSTTPNPSTPPTPAAPPAAPIADVKATSAAPVTVTPPPSTSIATTGTASKSAASATPAPEPVPITKTIATTTPATPTQVTTTPGTPASATPAPTTVAAATRSLPILPPKPPVKVANPQEAVQVQVTKIATNIVTPALETSTGKTKLAATTPTKGRTKVSTTTSSTPPTTSTVSSTTSGTNTSTPISSVAKVSSTNTKSVITPSATTIAAKVPTTSRSRPPPVPVIPDAGGARRLSSRAKKPTEKLRESGLLKSPTEKSGPSISIPISAAAAVQSSAAPTSTPTIRGPTTVINPPAASRPQKLQPTPAIRQVRPGSSDLITSSAPAAKKARRTSASTAVAVVPHVEPKMPSLTASSTVKESEPKSKPLALTPAASAVAPTRPAATATTTSSSVSSPATSRTTPTPVRSRPEPQPPELQNALLEEMQGLRQELRTVNRNLEEMIAASNRTNDTLNRFLAAQHPQPPQGHRKS